MGLYTPGGVAEMGDWARRTRKISKLSCFTGGIGNDIIT